MLAAGCQAPLQKPPTDGSGPSIGYQLKRLAHAEFGSKHLTDFEQAAARLPQAVSAEFVRKPGASPSWERFRQLESQRLDRPADAAERLLTLELDRGQRGAQRWAEQVDGDLLDRQTRRFLEGLAGVPGFLGLDRLPLAHPDDREFRTEPDDERAEAGLWARIARRLPPW